MAYWPTVAVTRVTTEATNQRWPTTVNDNEPPWTTAGQPSPDHQSTEVHRQLIVHTPTGTGGKSLAAIQGLLERSTLNVEADSFHHFSANATDAEVTSFVWSSVPPPSVMTAADTTTVIAGPSSTSIIGAGAKLVTQVYLGPFADSTSIGVVGPDIACPSNLVGTEFSADAFYVFQEMDSETLRHIYVPKWNVLRSMDYDHLISEFNVGAARQTCLGVEIGMRSKHNLRERKRFERRCPKRLDLLKETDVEIAKLKAQLSLKEANTTEPIRLCIQVSIVEAAKAARVATLESVAITKDIELASLNAQTAKLTQDLSSLQLSLCELSFQSCSLGSLNRDGLTVRVSLLKTNIVSDLRDLSVGYDFLKEQCKAIQDMMPSLSV
ncbi:hypothetical protein Tco_0635454 [Tanacetum coccineum]